MDGLFFDTERLYFDGIELATSKAGVPHTQEFEDAIAGTNDAQAIVTIHEFFPDIDAAALLLKPRLWRVRLPQAVRGFGARVASGDRWPRSGQQR